VTAAEFNNNTYHALERQELAQQLEGGINASCVELAYGSGPYTRDLRKFQVHHRHAATRISLAHWTQGSVNRDLKVVKAVQLQVSETTAPELVDPPPPRKRT
jgi:hypothetical protein